MKAYFPKLVTRKDASMASPQAINQVVSHSERTSFIGHHSNSAKDNRKKLVRHSNSMQGPAEQHRSMHGTGEIAIPAELSNQLYNNVDVSGGSLIIIDDQPRTVGGLSHDQGFLPLRRNRSQNRADALSVNHSQQPNSQIAPRMARRNSLADGNGPVAAAQTKDSRFSNNPMLPPIFSGPQKKASLKASKLIPLPPKSQYTSQISNSSPFQSKTENVSDHKRASTLDDNGMSMQNKSMLIKGDRNSAELSPSQEPLEDEDELIIATGNHSLVQPPRAKSTKNQDFVKKNEEKLK